VEEIAGTIILKADRNVHIRSIRLKIRGSEETRISRTTRKGTTRIYQERAVLADDEIVLFGESALKSPGSAIVDNIGVLLGIVHRPELPPGRHEYEFRLPVPEEWRPSYQGEHAWVRYELEACADIPIWPDMRHRQEIRITPPLTVRLRRPRPIAFGYPENRPKAVGVFAALSEMFVPEIRLTVTLDDKVFHRGSEMTGKLLLENLSERAVRQAIFELACFEVARAGRINEKTILARSEYSLPISQGSQRTVEERFSFPVPENAPASGMWAFFEIKWYLHVRLDIPLAGDVRCLRKVVVL